VCALCLLPSVARASPSVRLPWLARSPPPPPSHLLYDTVVLRCHQRNVDEALEQDVEQRQRGVLRPVVVHARRHVVAQLVQLLRHSVEVLLERLEDPIERVIHCVRVVVGRGERKDEGGPAMTT